MLVAGIGDRQLGQVEGVACRVQLAIASASAARASRTRRRRARRPASRSSRSRGSGDPRRTTRRRRSPAHARTWPAGAVRRSGVDDDAEVGEAEAGPAPRSGPGLVRRAAVQVHLLGDRRRPPSGRRSWCRSNGPSPGTASVARRSTAQCRRTSVKNVLTTSTAGVHASTHGPKFENAARPSPSSAPTATTPASAAGKNGRVVASLPADATTSDAARCSSSTSLLQRRRLVVDAVRAEGHHDDVDRRSTPSMARSMPALDRRVVAVAVAGEHPAVVDDGVRAQLADDPADERAVAGLQVEPAAAVVVGLVLVVPAPDRRQVAPRVVHRRSGREPRVLGRVWASIVRRPVSRTSTCGGRRPGDRQRLGQVRAARRPAGRGARSPPARLSRACRPSRRRRPPEVPGHAVGEVHVVRARDVASGGGRRSSTPSRSLARHALVASAPAAPDGRSAPAGRRGGRRAAASPRSSSDAGHRSGSPRTPGRVVATSSTTESGRTRQSRPARSVADGDAPSGQLRPRTRRAGPRSRGGRSHGAQTLNTVPRSGNR